MEDKLKDYPDIKKRLALLGPIVTQTISEEIIFRLLELKKYIDKPYYILACLLVDHDVDKVVASTTALLICTDTTKASIQLEDIHIIRLANKYNRLLLAKLLTYSMPIDNKTDIVALLLLHEDDLIQILTTMIKLNGHVSFALYVRQLFQATTRVDNEDKVVKMLTFVCLYNHYYDILKDVVMNIPHLSETVSNHVHHYKNKLFFLPPIPEDYVFPTTLHFAIPPYSCKHKFPMPCVGNVNKRMTLDTICYYRNEKIYSDDELFGKINMQQYNAYLPLAVSENTTLRNLSNITSDFNSVCYMYMCLAKYKILAKNILSTMMKSSVYIFKYLTINNSVEEMLLFYKNNYSTIVDKAYIGAYIGSRNNKYKYDIYVIGKKANNEVPVSRYEYQKDMRMNEYWINKNTI